MHTVPFMVLMLGLLGLAITHTWLGSSGQWKKLGTLIKTFHDNKQENSTHKTGIFATVNQKNVEKQERKKVLSTI